MSRAYKKFLAQQTIDEGSTIAGGAAGVEIERLSGADLAQVVIASQTGANPTVDTAGTKTLGTIASYTGSPNAAALTGSDLVVMAGEQAG